MAGKIIFSKYCFYLISVFNSSNIIIESLLLVKQFLNATVV